MLWPNAGCRASDPVAAARESTTPVYAISLAPALRNAAQLHEAKVSVDWEAAESKLREIAHASGGRFYSP